MEKKDLELVVYGAGAVGSSVGGWITSNYDKISLLARGDHAKIMKDKGLTLYQQEDKEKSAPIPVKVITDLSEQHSADVVIIAVKNYNLEEAAKDISSKLGDKPIIIGVQNGVKNQEILPKYFSKVIYGVTCYNAWRDEPGIVGYQSRGPIYIGTLKNENQSELEAVSRLFSLGFKTITTQKIQDAAQTKTALNLINSLMTLLGHQYREFTNFKLIGKLSANLLLEGVKIIKAAGYEPYKLEGLPTEGVLKLATWLPSFLRTMIYKKKSKKMVLNSMAQDILQRKKKDSELESLNGYILQLADSLGLQVPYNRTIYQLCKAEFSKPEFQPLSVEEVWDKVNENLT